MRKGKRTGMEAQIVEIINNRLWEKNDFISTEDIYSLIPNKKDNIDYAGCIKKAKKIIRDHLQGIGLQLEEKNSEEDSRIKLFRYPKNSPENFLDEYWESNRKLRLKTLNDLVQRSTGLFSESWLAKFKIQMEENINETIGKESKIIEFDTNGQLNNLSLLPTLYYAIRDKQVVEFSYCPFDKEERRNVFHPYYLKEYNSRWFAFGRAVYEDGKADENCNRALDRITSSIVIKKEVEYIPSSIDYSTYFDDIVGVTHVKDSKKEHIVIQTNDPYTHGRILTKPLHKSQKEIQVFDPTRRKGEISIDVKPNYELLGLLFSFESHIKILEPENYIDEFKKETIKLYKIYSDEYNR